MKSTMLSVPLNSLAVLHERGSISYESWTNRIYKGSLGYLHLGSFYDVFFAKGFFAFVLLIHKNWLSEPV